VTFLVGLALALTASPETLAKLTPAIGEANVFRVIFFTLTFFQLASSPISGSSGKMASANSPQFIS